MAFGTSVSALSQSAIGLYGYIIKINTANLLAQTITSVQAQASPTTTPEPVSGATTYAALYAYLDEANCPDLAYSYADGECSIFFKTSIFAYAAETRVALFGKRKAQNCDDDSDLLDVPDKDLNLLVAYCLKLAYSLKIGGTPKYVQNLVDNNEQVIRGAS